MHEFDEHQQSKWRSPDCNHGDQSSRLQGPEMVQSFNIVFKEEPEDDHEPWGQRNTGMSPASSHGSEETTSTSGEPEQHQEKHNTATSSHRCFGCGQEFPAAYDLVLHQRTHVERGFNKSICGELFYRKELLKTHHQKVDTGIPVQHQKNPKAKKSHDCVVCGKQLSEAMKLKRHMRTHTGEKPHGCSVCGRGFTQKGNLKTHMKTHRGLNPKLWSAGEDSPSTSGEPEQHQKNHTAKTFHNCIDCGEICQTLPALKKHMKTHTSKKPSYQCSLCGAEFTEKGQIQDHQLQHVGEKPYSCPDCGKCFVNESYIEIHQRTHTGERPYSCLVCGNSFVKKAYLKSHLLTHTGEKPYLCSICGKTYSREGTFKIHQRVHTGEKPYLCTECGKRFSCRANLYSHKKRHDGKPIGPKRQLGRPKQLPN